MRSEVQRLASSLMGMLVVIVLGITPSPAGVAAEVSVAGDPQASGRLDGMVFVGKIGLIGNLDLDDELHFSAGRFWSQNCISCGYTTGNYWTRRVGDATHFQGILQSDDRGSLAYSGRILDGRAEVDIKWTQRRWYWSIERDLAFVGKLDQTRAPASPAGETALAGAQQQALGQCRSIL